MLHGNVEVNFIEKQEILRLVIKFHRSQIECCRLR